ncbi:hypothetical protein FPOAC1_007511 [Fusarium poae]|nr:hypothetical protein FPOAC1_007511 [Fusarium poae]KAG8668140.1 hypothetical protein FPOAC1_007511 [Fusarium poae]
MEEGPAADPEKYPGPRASSAAQRVHYYCGKWPHELLGRFEPAIWVERLSDEFATLVRLTVKSPQVQLEDVIQRLKDLARGHPYDGAKYVNRQDIATIRESLRKEGVDVSHYRRRSRNSAGEDYDYGDDSLVIKSGSEDAVVIAETPFDSEDLGDNLSDFENEFHIGETEHEEQSTNEDNQASTHQNHSHATTPVRQNTHPVARSAPSEPSSTRMGEHHTPASQPLAQLGTTPSTNRVQSPSDRFRASDATNTHFRESLRRRTMASSVSRRGSSSQPHVALRGDGTQPNPSTPVERPDDSTRGTPLAAPAPATPSRRANRSPNRRVEPEPHVRTETRQQTTSDRTEVRQPPNTDTQASNTETQHGPSTPGSDIQASINPIPTPSRTPTTPGPSSNGPPSLMRLIESRSAAATRSQQVIKVEDDSPPPTALHSHPDGPSGSRRNTSTHVHETAPPSVSRDSGTYGVSTPTRPVPQPNVGSASSGSRPFGSHRNTSTNTHETAPPSISQDARTFNASTPTGPDAQSNVGPASFSSTSATERFIHRMVPPTRHAHALPLSALVNRDVSRKRPLESDRPVASSTPQQPATSSPLRAVHDTITAPAEASSSQTTPTNNSGLGAMTSTRATPTNSVLMEPNPHLQPAIPRPNPFFSTRPHAWVNEEPSSRPAHTHVSQPSIAVPAQTSSQGTVENRPSKRQRSDDPRQPFTSPNEPIDFDATLPDGESFKRELREWRSWVEPHITDINTKLENLQNEIRALHQITFNNKSNKEDTTKKMQEIQQSMQDNNKHITKAYMIIEVLEPESVGDETTRVYLEKRRRQLAEREMKQQSYEEELSQAQTVLREIDVQQPMIEKKLDDFVLDETQIRKSKESLESAMRKWRFQIDLFDGEGGWVRSLERPEPSFRADGVDGFQ